MARLFVLEWNGLILINRNGKAQPKVYTSIKNAEVAIKNLDSSVYNKEHINIVEYCPANDAISQVFVVYKQYLSDLERIELVASYKSQSDAENVCDTWNKIDIDTEWIYYWKSVSVN